MDIKLQFYVLFLSRKLLMHTFLLQIQSTHTFCCKNDLSTLVLLQKQFTHTFFVAKTIYALHPESFCALTVAIRKVQTFWASAPPHDNISGNWVLFFERWNSRKRDKNFGQCLKENVTFLVMSSQYSKTCKSWLKFRGRWLKAEKSKDDKSRVSVVVLFIFSWENFVAL